MFCVQFWYGLILKLGQISNLGCFFGSNSYLSNFRVWSLRAFNPQRSNWPFVRESCKLRFPWGNQDFEVLWRSRSLKRIFHDVKSTAMLWEIEWERHSFEGNENVEEVREEIISTKNGKQVIIGIDEVTLPRWRWISGESPPRPRSWGRESSPPSSCFYTVSSITNIYNLVVTIV